jgi:hypothetical protein
MPDELACDVFQAGWRGSVGNCLGMARTPRMRYRLRETNEKKFTGGIRQR